MHKFRAMLIKLLQTRVFQISHLMTEKVELSQGKTDNDTLVFSADCWSILAWLMNI